MLPTSDKERKALPILTFLTQYFPDAILEMVKVAVAGDKQHNANGDPATIRWAREKSTDQLNTAQRHIWDHATGNPKDTDGRYHLGKALWRLAAELQLTIEKDQANPDVLSFTIKHNALKETRTPHIPAYRFCSDCGGDLDGYPYPECLHQVYHSKPF